MNNVLRGVIAAVEEEGEQLRAEFYGAEGPRGRRGNAPVDKEMEERLLSRGDQRITRTGVVVIKAQQHRSLEQNRAEALARLRALVAAAAHVPRKRKATKPSFSSKLRRLDGKNKRAKLKNLRRRVVE